MYGEIFADIAVLVPDADALCLLQVCTYYVPVCKIISNYIFYVSKKQYRVVDTLLP